MEKEKEEKEKEERYIAFKDESKKQHIKFWCMGRG